MTALVIVAKVLVVIFTATVAGLGIYAVMRATDEPMGRVTSWPRRFRASDPDAGILGHSPEEWERSTRRFEEGR